MVSITGGNKFEAAMAELASKLATGKTLRVGFLENATYPDGTSVPFVAAMNEFGNNNSPPRPFFRNMIQAKSPEWPAAIAGLLQSTDCDVDKTLMLTGEAIKGQLQESINTLTSPPLAESTIARKGHSKPLIDTSVMVNSVDYDVKS